MKIIVLRPLVPVCILDVNGGFNGFLLWAIITYTIIIIIIILTPRPPIVFTITAAIAGLCPTFKQQFVIATDGLLVAGLGTNVFRGGKGALDTCSMFMPGF